MSLFERHIDGLLGTWATGELTPRQASRLLRHARGCGRCRVRYERLVLAHRLLESGEGARPSEPESRALELAHLEGALAAAQPERTSAVRRFAVLALVPAAVALVLWVLPLQTREADQWQARGPGKDVQASLRVFCRPPGEPLREVGGVVASKRGCPRGATLAFAAGAVPPLAFVALRVEGDGQQLTEAPLRVTGQPGKEVPLETTPALDLPVGPAVAVAAFGADADLAREALAAKQPETGRVIRVQFLVEAAP